MSDVEHVPWQPSPRQPRAGGGLGRRHREKIMVTTSEKLKWRYNQKRDAHLSFRQGRCREQRRWGTPRHHSRRVKDKPTEKSLHPLCHPLFWHACDRQRGKSICVTSTKYKAMPSNGGVLGPHMLVCHDGWRPSSPPSCIAPWTGGRGYVQHT